MSLIVPQFLQQYDKRLKCSSPILWATRFHFVLFYVILAYFSTVVFACWSYESSWSYHLSRKLWPFILIGLAAWIIATKNIDSRIDYQLRLRWSKVRTYFVYWFCASLIIALPFALRQTHTHLVQKQIHPLALVFDWVNTAQAQTPTIETSTMVEAEQARGIMDNDLYAYITDHAPTYDGSIVEHNPSFAVNLNYLTTQQPVEVPTYSWSKETQTQLLDESQTNWMTPLQSATNESNLPTSSHNWNQVLPFSGNVIWSKVMYLDLESISNNFETLLFGQYQNEFPWIPVLFIGFCISLVIQILLSIGWSGFIVSIGVQLFLIICSIVAVQYLNTVMPGPNWNILILLTLLSIYVIGIYISFFVKRARNNWHTKAFGVISFALLSPVVISLLFMLKGYLNISFLHHINYDWAWLGGIIFYMCLFPIVNNLLLRLKGAYE